MQMPMSFKYGFLVVALLMISCSDPRHEKIQQYLQSLCECEKVEYASTMEKGVEHSTYTLHNCKNSNDSDIALDVMQSLSRKMPQICRMNERLTLIFSNNGNIVNSGTFKNCFPDFSK